MEGGAAEVSEIEADSGFVDEVLAADSQQQSPNPEMPPNVNHDLNLIGKFWKANTEGEEPSSPVAEKVNDEFTIVMSKSQRKKQKKNKKILLQKSDPYNTRFKAGISKPNIFHE